MPSGLVVGERVKINLPGALEHRALGTILRMPEPAELKPFSVVLVKLDRDDEPARFWACCVDPEGDEASAEMPFRCPNE